MKHSFILSCESTVDLPYSYVSGRDIPVIFYSYMVGDTEYTDDMGRDPGALPRFYGFLQGEILPSTSQINAFRYTEFFEKLLEEGDVLHIALGSGMTQSIANARRAADELRERYPQRRIIVLDSLCSSSGYGMLVDYAADMRDAGSSIDEVAQWVRENCNCIHHQFFSTDLKFYRRTGRMSGSTATVAAILNICPIMRLNAEGRIIAYDKVRGRKRAIRTTVEVMQAHARGGADYSGKCFICHSNSLEDALETRDALIARFPKLQEEIRICDIGTIIASHCGPGTVAVFFLGDARIPGEA